MSKGKAIWSKIKLTLKVVMGLVLFGLIAISVWMLFTVDDPAEREQNAILYLEKEEKNIVPYIKYFSNYDKIYYILHYNNEYNIGYVHNPNATPGKWKFATLILNLENEEYYLSSTAEHFTSINKALEYVGMETSDFELWKSFLKKYNLYLIGFGGVDHRYIRVVFNRFHIVPHGLIYVPSDLEEEFKSLKSQIPGRLRDGTGTFEIMTHIKGRWFYYEGP